MNTSIAIFLVVGVVFGLATVSQRHLYSEGPAHRGADDTLGAKVLWVLTCTFLWPLMLLSRLFALWHRRAEARRVRVAATPSSRPTPRSPPR